MSQVDNRNSSASKRARTDGSRREDDWTCPSCGNVNFSFRTTCNMRNCTQPRPADHNTKSAPKPVQLPHGYTSSSPYMNAGAPSSMYLSVPPYGSSLFNGSPIPPYDVPYSGGSAYHYSYGGRLSTGSPYRPIHLPGPAPYSSASMIGGMYGVPPMMDRYGLSLPMSPAMGPRPGFYLDDHSQKKGADGMRDNDWTCPKCGNINFSFRPVCNMRKCNTPKPGSQPSKSDKNSKQKMPDGSWKCEKCNNINYPFRTKCNRQNCGADKPNESPTSASPSADENDQVRCGVHIFCTSKVYLTLVWLLVTNVECTMFDLIMLMVCLDYRFCLFLCDLYFLLFFLGIALVNLKLSTVPVSFRVVQPCSVWVSESQSCRPRVAAGCQVTLPFIVCVRLLYKLRWYCRLRYHTVSASIDFDKILRAIFCFLIV